MPRSSSEPFTLLGTTPEIEKYKGHAVALSPVAPLVAEIGILGYQKVLRITDYMTGAVVGLVPIPYSYDILSFSPEGKRLLALKVGPVQVGPYTARGVLLGYSEPWTAPQSLWPTVGDQIFLRMGIGGGIIHATWLDEQTILIAGSNNAQRIGVGVLKVSSRVPKIVLLEENPLGIVRKYSTLDYEINQAVCSPSGLVAYSTRSGESVVLYQLNHAHNAMETMGIFPYSAYGGMLIKENGQALILGRRLFIRQSQQIKMGSAQLPERRSYAFQAAYRYGTVCWSGSDDDRATKTLLIYQIRGDQFHLWCSIPHDIGRNIEKGVDLAMHDGKILVAYEEDDRTTILELTDFDIVQLNSPDAQQRVEAAQNLGSRRLQSVIPALERTLGDEVADVQVAAIEALAEIGDPRSLPSLIRTLGRTQDDDLQRVLISALRRFPMMQLDPAVLDCLARSGGAYRLGAVRVLNAMPTIEALEELCDAIKDADQEVRVTATHALQKRGDLRACIALLAHLNDEDERFRLTVQQAVIALLEVGQLFSGEESLQLALPIDMVTYVNDVIATGRMRAFEDTGDPLVGKFLTGLAMVCIHNNQSLPQLLTALDALATHHITADRASVSIGLTIALICANTLKEKQRWHEALSMYNHAVAMARRAEAPQIEWRSWYAAGICFEALEDDQAALTAFRNAMSVIDRLWFLLLEEDKLRNFFQDKTLLYDKASLCALRLGYSAFALECGEKAKTRYLGDLIARRQMDPRVVLNRDLKEFWENIGRLRSIRVPVSTPRSGKTERVEVVAIQEGSSEPNVSSVKPERLAALEEASQHNKELQNRLGVTQRIWQVMTYISATEDDFFQEYVEEIYQSLLPVYQARKSAALPLPRKEQSSIISQYNDAARALNEAGQGSQNIPYWIFAENQGWVREVCNATEDDEITLLLDAVMEALNAVLHHEPVFGVATDTTEEESQSPVFVTRTFNPKSTDPSQGSTIIETPLELRTQSRWRYISRIARGEIIAYRDIADTLYGQPKVAQLQFSITEHGTIVFVSHRTVTMRKRTGALPDLHGEDDLHVFTNPDVTLASLRQLLHESEESWFVRYRHRNQEEGLQAWMEAMDRTLQWLYAHLFEPLDAYLKEKGVQRLRIIPHRALHLIPFAALFSTDESGQRHYLIDDYDIEYAPSATLQHICRERARGRSFQQSLTAIANPTGDLPFASTEVGEAMRHFPAANVQLLEGNNASISAIAPTVSASVFHFAGHGHYDWDDPLSSDLLFANGEQLSLADLFAETLSMPATMLAVLSACETNITNPEDLADEYLGLASGFLFAGTPSVVSTLWTVDDISTSLLIQQFYQSHFNQGLHASQALRAAQLWLRDTVNHGFLLEYIQSQLAILEQQRKQLSYLKMADSIDPQKRRLQTLLKFLRYQEKKHLSNVNPYAHPYYWAAYTINTG